MHTIKQIVAVLILVGLVSGQATVVHSKRVTPAAGGGAAAVDVNCAQSDASSTTNCTLSSTTTVELVIFAAYNSSADAVVPTVDGSTTGVSNRWKNTSSFGRRLGMWLKPSVASGSHTIHFDDPGVNNVQLVVIGIKNFTAIDSTAAQEWKDDNFGNLTFNNMTSLTGTDVCFGLVFETSFNPVTSVNWGSWGSAQADATFATKGAATGIKTGVTTSTQPSVTMSGYGNGALGEFCAK